jgi:N-acylglucosamine-6-phosphate 2-epimerase
MLTRDALAARWRGGLIASCQPVRGGVFDAPEHTARFALAALAGGAVGLRVEGLADLIAVRAAADAYAAAHGTERVAIVGLVKIDAPPTHAFITPTPDHAAALAAAGADVIAYDATDRLRPYRARDVVAAIHAAGACAMADLSTRVEGEAALADGADFLASTLSGYAPGSPAMEGPDLALVAALAALPNAWVIAEGRIATPREAAAAHARGALAVTIGTAWSRPEWIVAAFVRALAS